MSNDEPISFVKRPAIIFALQFESQRKLSLRLSVRSVAKVAAKGSCHLAGTIPKININASVGIATQLSVLRESA